MPYKLQGTSVVKSDSGEVVKRHPTREKALAHLRALKANVEEDSPVLGALLEGFDEAAHPRGFHGRWVRGRGGKPGRLEGSYNGVKLERGVAYQGELAGGKVFTGHWTGEVQGFGREGASAQEPIFRHVDDPTMRRTFSGGKFYGRLSDVKPPAPNEQRSDEMASGPLRRPTEADMRRGREAAAGAQGVLDELTAKGWTRDETGKLVPPADRSGVGPEGAAARDRGASSLTSEHADTRDKLTGLPRGQKYGLHGPGGQVGHVERTAQGWAVTGPDGAVRVHKTPSSAAGHAMRIQRQAAANYQTRQRTRAANLDRIGVPLGKVGEAAPELLGALLEGR